MYSVIPKNLLLRKFFFETGPLINFLIFPFFKILKAISNEFLKNKLDLGEIFSKALFGLYFTFIKFIDELFKLYRSSFEKSKFLIFF